MKKKKHFDYVPFTIGPNPYPPFRNVSLPVEGDFVLVFCKSVEQCRIRAVPKPEPLNSVLFSEPLNSVLF
jgi:hypothetical protein